MMYNMAIKDNVQLILHGVGTSQLVFTDGTILSVDKAQDIEIKSDATTAEVNGGDSFYALLEYITKKTGSVTITNATMSLADLKAATGDDVTAAAEVWIPSESVTLTSGAGALAKTTNVIIDTVRAQLPDGTALTNIGATGTPTATQFTVTTSGVITTASTVTGPLTVSYYYTDSTGLAIHSLEDSVPGNCELRHKIITDEMDDGNRYELDIRVYKCKAKGSYDYTGKTGSAFAPKLEFSMLNAGRTDKRVFSYSVRVYTA
jgi:hypothetical protein